MNISKLHETLPENLAEIVAGYAFRPIHLGLSPSKTFRLEARGRANLYLKAAPPQPGFSLRREKTKLEWLAGRLPVPQVLLFAERDDAEYLLISEIAGLPASDDSLKTDVPRIVEELAAGLRMIHALPVEDCPFDGRIDAVVPVALERMRKGLVDADDFDDERLGRSVADLARELLETRPAGEDPVFTHGDYCLPNIILENGRLRGFIDLGNAGVADRYQDLALLARSVGDNFGAAYRKSVFEFYGVAPDHEKIRFYQLLDEFF